MLRGFFKNIPEELEDAAMIDGLSRTGMIFRIVLPLTAPGLTTTAIFTFVSAWNEFIFALSAGFQTDHAADYHGALRLGKKQRGGMELFDGTAVVATIPTVLLFLLVRKRLTAGLMSGAVTA